MLCTLTRGLLRFSGVWHYFCTSCTSSQGISGPNSKCRQFGTSLPYGAAIPTWPCLWFRIHIWGPVCVLTSEIGTVAEVVKLSYAKKKGGSQTNVKAFLNNRTDHFSIAFPWEKFDDLISHFNHLFVYIHTSASYSAKGSFFRFLFLSVCCFVKAWLWKATNK